MPRNAEVKFKIPSAAEFDRILAAANQQSDFRCFQVWQQDTFLPSVKPGVRVKVRIEDDDDNDYSAELIVYSRGDKASVRESEYSRDVLSVEAARRLIESVPTTCQVNKTRTVVLIGQSRLHLDSVDNLGLYGEIEVVLTEKQTVEQGVCIAKALLQELGVTEDQFVNTAYADLIS